MCIRDRVGDSSDNVPGARGVGPKTAVQLLEQYPDIERLIENADSLKPPRASKSLSENADMVRLSKRLVTIMTDLEIELDLEALRVQEPNNEALRDLFVELEFRRLSDQFASAAQSSRDETQGQASVEIEDRETDYAIIDSLADVELLVAELRAAGSFSIAAESSHEDPLRGELVGLAVSVESGIARYLPFAHTQPFALTFEGEGSNETRILPGVGDPKLEVLRDLLEDPAVGKSGHDLKQAALVLATSGVTLAGFEVDAMIASYVLDPGKRGHDLRALSMETFSHKPLDRSDVTLSLIHISEPTRPY